MGIESQLLTRLEFLQEAERLKDTLRSGFTSEGRSESSAEHSWRLTLLAMTIADLLPDLDLLKLLKLCVIHDLGEIVEGDVPAPLQVAAKSKSIKEREDFVSLLASLPEHLKDEYLSLWDEYEKAESYEAQVAKALDKIETLIQHNQGRNPTDFDYEFNLVYGKQYTDAIPLLKHFRSIIDEDTKKNVVNSRKDKEKK